MPVGIAKLQEILLHAAETDLGLSVNSYFSTRYTRHFRNNAPVSAFFRIVAHTQKRPVGWKSGVVADEFVEIALSIPRQLRCEYLDLFRKHSDAKWSRVEQIMKGLCFGSVT